MVHLDLDVSLTMKLCEWYIMDADGWFEGEQRSPSTFWGECVCVCFHFVCLIECIDSS